VVGVAMAAAIAAVPNPGQTPNAFVSEQYGLTFRTPRSSTYCALPKDWVGSDHGTVVFLAPPKKCYAADYPSSGRGFNGNPPRIEVFYAHDPADDEENQKPAPCKEVARVTFLGKPRPLCQTSSRRGIEVAVSAKYPADIPAEAIITLITSAVRLQADLRKFEALLQSARTCTAIWHDDKGGKGDRQRAVPSRLDIRFWRQPRPRRPQGHQALQSLSYSG
jgi:hypothetical protein